jgi:hypothetical protein
MRLDLVYSAVPTTAKHLNTDRRRALEMLAAAGWRGCTGATLLARGLAHETLASVVHDGLATVQSESVTAGGLDVIRVRITDNGRRALER